MHPRVWLPLLVRPRLRSVVVHVSDRFQSSASVLFELFLVGRFGDGEENEVAVVPWKCRHTHEHFVAIAVLACAGENLDGDRFALFILAGKLCVFDNRGVQLAKRRGL